MHPAAGRFALVSDHLTAHGHVAAAIDHLCQALLKQNDVRAVRYCQDRQIHRRLLPCLANQPQRYDSDQADDLSVPGEAERTGVFPPLHAGAFSAYSHRPDDLRAELTESGLEVTDLVSVEGRR